MTAGVFPRDHDGRSNFSATGSFASRTGNNLRQVPKHLGFSGILGDSTLSATAHVPLTPVDERTFVRMIRYALATGGERLHFRPGYRPLQQGMGPDRELRHRQLTCEDTLEIAGHFLKRAKVPKRLSESQCDAAQSLYLFYELEGEALIEAQMQPARGGISLHVDVIRPMPHPSEIEVVEY
jgi:hypothetical protein